jgi:hypothetical protein
MSLVTDVAALFVDPKGHYPALVADCWDQARDARLYAGHNPVVAHPPCQLWVNFAHLNYKRYGGEHNRPGNDGGCFAHALATVRANGGVLEHPASSHAWKAFGLTAPQGIGWKRVNGREWTCEVWQSAYGHKARKRTWLWYVGDRPPIQAKWDRDPGSHQVGWFDRNKPTLGKREASASPLGFAEYLIALARHSREPQPSAADDKAGG